MAESDSEVRCPKCSRLIPVAPEWRVVVCPGCGEVVTRMTSDATYD